MFDGAGALVAEKELPRLLGEPADLTVFPEGFLRSKEDLTLALGLTAERPGTVLAGYREETSRRRL